MQKRKGFTLVELVIVIAVIAILAGVLIGTFASVINKANESAKMQELKAAEHEQKATDLLKKIEDSNWYGWEDFETSIVDKLTKAYKENSSSSQGLTQAQVKEVVEAALADYAKNNAGQNTELTEEQVKAIIENALGTFKFNGVTEAQVKAIVSAAATGLSSTQLTASQVKSIVNAANANNVTAAQVSALLATALKDVTTKDELDTALTTAVNNLTNTITTVAENINLAQVLEELVPITKVVTTPEQFTAAVAGLNSGSTIVVGTPGLTLEVSILTDVKTFTIKGEDIAELKINAPKSTIYVINNVTKLDVVAVASSSLHLYGDVNELTVNKGRTVVEAGATVAQLTAAPTVSATVTVEIEKNATVTSLTAEYQKNGNTTNDWIEIANNGTVGTAELTVVTGTSENTKITTNVHVTNGAGATGTTTSGEKAIVVDNSVKATEAQITVVDTTTGDAKTYTVDNEGAYVPTAQTVAFWGTAYATSFAGGTGTYVDPYQISNAYELTRLSYLMLTNPSEYKDAYYVLTNDIDLTGKTWMPISSYTRNLPALADKWFAGVFDGQGYTINGVSDSDASSLVFDGFFGSNSSTIESAKAEYVFGLFGSVKNATLKNVKLTNVSIEGKAIVKEDNLYVADSVGALVGFSEGSITIHNISVTGSVEATDSVGGVIGRMYNKGKSDNTIVITNCTNSATVTGNNPSGYARTGGVFAYVGADNKNVTIENNTNNGEVTVVSCNHGRYVSGVGNFATSGLVSCSVKNNANSGDINITDTYTGNEAISNQISSVVNFESKSTAITASGNTNTGVVTINEEVFEANKVSAATANEVYD